MTAEFHGATLAAFLLLGCLASPSVAQDLYVAPNGDDAHSGLGAEAGKALRTIQAAVDKAQPGDTILVRGGVYRETVTFPRSGAPGKPITLRPRQNEKVVITGCDPVTGWTRHKGNIWNASMPWTLGLGRNQVFVDGEVMIEARFPNTAAPGLEMYVADLSPLWPTFGEFSIPDPKNAIGRVTSRLLEGQPDDHWKGALYYGVHYQGWSAQTGVIESSKSGEIVVGDRTRTWWFPRPYGQGGHEEGRGMIVGHLNALDEPGEWHWQDGLLYLIPKTDGEPRQVEAKRRQLAFDLSGREHIRIEGVTLQAASVRMQDSAWCTFDRCDLSHISHFTRHYDIGQVETGRDTLKSGETGLFVGGHDNAFLNCSVRVSAGAGFYLRGYHHTIHNCLIDEVSYTSHYLNAITDAVSDFADYENFLVGGHVITYNTMRNAGRHFFNFYGNGCSTASRTRGPMDYLATLFAHNHLYNGMLQTRDAGFLTGYYGSGGTLNGLHAQVAYNVLHDNYDIAGMRWNVLGHIYLDAGTCHVDVRNNLLWAAPGSLQRALWFNTCCLNCSDRDNVFLPNFARTCAELVPDNFPNGQPFRFGHDFQNPPPLPKWPQLETRLLDAQACTFRSSGLATSDAGLSNLKDGEWFGFDGVDMSQGWQSVIMRFASDVKQLNADKSNRAHPRHRKATDPLVMQAVSNDGTAAEIGKQWTFIRNVKDGSWIRFNEAPLGEGYERFRVVYGKVTDATAWVEVHLDSAGGPLAARVPLSRTDRVRGASIQIYGEATAEVSADAKGTRDVFLVFRTEDKKPVGEFEYFRLERYRGQIALAKDEVKLEVRVGRKDGEKLGEFYPRCTGGQASFREMVATLEPATGTQPLFLVVRSALAEPVGSIAWLRLEKAAQPQDLTALGLPPRVDAQGRMILPAPTHRPRAKPADKYATVIARQAPRPMFLAARSLAGPLAAEPSSRSLALAETWDGNLSAAPRSMAWIAYDDHALLIAVRHPVTDATALRSSANRWGQDNGMEIALQDGLKATPGPALLLRGYPNGQFESVRLPGAPPEPSKKLGAAVSYRAAISPGEWSCEWRIPFAAADFTPKTAPVILFNLAAHKPAQKDWVLWRGAGGPTAQMAQAGLLVFQTEAADLADIPKSRLAVWLDAADAASVEKDADGKVAGWKDRSGNGRDAVQKNPAHRPAFVATGLNGRPALRFHETPKTRLELPDLSDQKITVTAFAVISNPEPGDPVNHHPRVFTASDGKEYDYQIGIALHVPGMETGGPRLLTDVFADRWAKFVRVGCFSPNYQTYFTGLLSEIVVYDRALSQDEADRVRAHLSAKWNLEP